jgi:T5SS/PEP-CTERM-associated repeat protein
MVIGQAGAGSVSVTGGALLKLAVPGEVRLGFEAGGTGALRVSGFGSEANFNSSSLIVGRGGQGTIDLDSSGLLEAGTLSLGRSPLENRITVSDKGILGVLNEMVVGDGGRGTFTMQQGAQGTVRRLIVGRNSQANNLASLSGFGTRLSGSDRIYIGETKGRGRLEVINGAQAHPAEGLGVAVYDNATGSLLVSRDAYVQTFSDFIVGGGQNSQATASLEEDAALDCLDLLIFAQPSGTSAVEVTGEFTVLTIRDQLEIGLPGAGQGPGLLRASGGFISVATNMFVNRSGRVEISGAQVKVGAAEYPPAGTVRIGPGGKLAGAGRVVGNVELAGGRLAPGTSPGTLTIEGNYAQTAGVLEIEIAGPNPGAEHDLLNVTGAAALGGALSISFIEAYAPKAGQRFTVLSAAGGTAGNFRSVTIEGLAPGFNYTTAPDAAGHLVLLAQNDGIAASAPRLQISRAAQSIVISWPFTGAWALETSATAKTGSWQPVPQTPASLDGKASVTLPLSADRAFYRLRQ